MNEFIYSAKWCELLFENRNKKYGAYQIRMREADNTIIAWLTSGFFVLSIVGLLAWMGGPSKEFIAKMTDKTKPDIVYNMNNVKVSLPPLSGTSTPVSSSKGTGAPIVKDERIPDIKDPIMPLVPVPPGSGTTPGIDVPIDLPPLTGGGETPGIETPFSNPMLAPAVMPSYPGGEKAMLKYLQAHIRYPQELVQKEIMGVVYIGFIIGKDGKVYDMKVMKSVKDGDALAQEAMRVISAMPAWTPGQQGGKNVAVSYVLPVNFITQR